MSRGAVFADEEVGEAADEDEEEGVGSASAGAGSHMQQQPGAGAASTPRGGARSAQQAGVGGVGGMQPPAGGAPAAQQPPSGSSGALDVSASGQQQGEGAGGTQRAGAGSAGGARPQPGSGGGGTAEQPRGSSGKHCNFSSLHPKVLAALPRFISEQLPCVTTNRGRPHGLEPPPPPPRAATPGLAPPPPPSPPPAGVPAPGLAGQGAHGTHTHNTRARSRAHPTAGGTIAGADNTSLPEYGALSSYKRYIPSAPYVMSTFKAFMETAEAPYMKAFLMTLGGHLLKLDHSFKVTKNIRLASGEQAYSACLTVMNEYVHVVAQFFVTNKSLETVRSQLATIMDNYAKLQLQLPEYVYVDDVKGQERLGFRSSRRSRRCLPTHRTSSPATLTQSPPATRSAVRYRMGNRGNPDFSTKDLQRLDNIQRDARAAGFADSRRRPRGARAAGAAARPSRARSAAGSAAGGTGTLPWQASIGLFWQAAPPLPEQAAKRSRKGQGEGTAKLCQSCWNPMAGGKSVHKGWPKRCGHKG
ncbi:MAG: hypothetical protein J3K34DRAFT_446611 [Monoraphidium minutum]|nr:MAG: hypothetical protein J3K34DRAFT_446611 [Monoraphidium minutum]